MEDYNYYLEVECPSQEIPEVLTLERVCQLLGEEDLYYDFEDGFISLTELVETLQLLSGCKLYLVPYKW